jgi:hypothetical protein
MPILFFAELAFLHDEEKIKEILKSKSIKINSITVLFLFFFLFLSFHTSLLYIPYPILSISFNLCFFLHCSFSTVVVYLLVMALSTVMKILSIWSLNVLMVTDFLEER